MNVKEEILLKYSAHAKSIAQISQLESVLEDLGLMDVDVWMDFGTGFMEGEKYVDKPYINVEPRHLPGIAIGLNRAGEPTMALVDTTPTLRDAALALLPKVGKWEKSFDPVNNLVILTAYYKDVRLRLTDAPPSTCTVEKVEEEVEVPEKVTPAHTEKKVRYVLKGDCDPLLAEN